MYGIVLMMSLSGGADLPANDMFEPAPKLTQPAYRHRGHGCCGGGYGGCYGGGCYGGGCYGGGGHGAAYVGGCYGGYAGYAYGASLGYSGYAYGSMPSSSYYTYYPSWGSAPGYSSYSTYSPAMPNAYGNFREAPAPSTQPGAEQERPREERRAPAPGDRPKENLPPENRSELPRFGDSAPIFLIVKLPADAKLTVDGTVTRSTGETRSFKSPPMQTGKEFRYTIRAEIERDGKMTRADKEVTVRAGQKTMVQLDPSSFTPESK